MSADTLLVFQALPPLICSLRLQIKTRGHPCVDVLPHNLHVGAHLRVAEGLQVELV